MEEKRMYDRNILGKDLGRDEEKRKIIEDWARLEIDIQINHCKNVCFARSDCQYQSAMIGTMSEIEKAIPSMDDSQLESETVFLHKMVSHELQIQILHDDGSDDLLFTKEQTEKMESIGKRMDEIERS